MVIFIFWLTLAILVGVYASSKGRSGVGFFLIAVLLSPLIGFIIALVVAPIRANIDATVLQSGEYKKCPYCAELVKIEAIVCKHCGRDLPKQEAKAEPVQERIARTICFYCKNYEAKGRDKSMGKCTLHQKRAKAFETCGDFAQPSN